MLNVDLHIHSIHSGHAYGTIYDIIAEAKRKKMKIIAITDHGPALIGGAPIFHFTMGNRKPKTPFILLWGAEANIIDASGNIDIPKEKQNRVDLIIAGMHLKAYTDKGKKDNTEAMIKMLRSNRIHILSHPNVNDINDFDMEPVCIEAIKQDILLEINLAYMNLLDKFPLEEFKKIIDIARKYKKKLIVNTDAHFLHEIGDDTVLRKHWKALGMTDDIMINNYPDELMRFIKSK